jgi:hypothetical protein
MTLRPQSGGRGGMSSISCEAITTNTYTQPPPRAPCLARCGAYAVHDGQVRIRHDTAEHRAIVRVGADDRDRQGRQAVSHRFRISLRVPPVEIDAREAVPVRSLDGETLERILRVVELADAQGHARVRGVVRERHLRSTEVFVKECAIHRAA